MLHPKKYLVLINFFSAFRRFDHFSRLLPPLPAPSSSNPRSTEPRSTEPTHSDRTTFFPSPSPKKTPPQLQATHIPKHPQQIRHPIHHAQHLQQHPPSPSSSSSSCFLPFALFFPFPPPLRFIPPSPSVFISIILILGLIWGSFEIINVVVVDSFVRNEDRDAGGEDMMRFSESSG